MSGISGYPSQEKLVNPLDGFDPLKSKTTSQFVTVHETADKTVVADVQIHGVFNTTAIAKSISSIDVDYPQRVIHSVAHGAVKGDRVRFDVGSANADFAAMIIDTPDANTMILGSTLPNVPLITDTFFVQRSIAPLYAQDGSLLTSSGPIQFVKDSVNVQVTEDTVTPGNNIPLPVKLTSVTGDINITAGDLNVQLSDQGVNADVTRIGDGTNQLGITASNEAKVNDSAARTSLASIDGKVANGAGTDVNAVRVVLENVQSTAVQDTASVLGSVSAVDAGPIATSDFLKIGGQDGTNDIMWKMTAAGAGTVSVTASVLPTGAATEATLSAMSGKLPATLGQKASAASMAVVIASDQSAVPISAASLPLPTGAATEATLATLDGKVTACNTGAVVVSSSALPTGAATEATLSSINTKTPALGQAAMAASTPVVISSDQSTLPVSAASLPLPTGAATEATLAAMSAKLPATLGQKASAASLAAVLSSEQEALIGALTETAPATDTASSGLNGRLQRIAQRITSLIALVPASLGQKTMANSFAVTIASDQTALPSLQRNKVQQLFNDYSSTSVTTAAYTQLVASTSGDVTRLEVFDSSGEVMILAVGAAASEVDQLYIFPGGQGLVDLYIPSGSRISIKAKTATASVGLVAINLYS